MTQHKLTLQKIAPLTHNVNRLTFDKPAGYDFTPGQATELALDKDGWRDETRPFTFTSFPEDDHLEFTIKSYPDHDGVTEQIGQMQPGDTVLIGDAWGAIEDKGPGTFIAGGAGLTPFIPILRQRERDKALDGCTLIFANQCARDVILKGEWDAMEGLKTVYVLEEEDADFAHKGRVDRDFLKSRLNGGMVYICGPDPMIEAVEGAVKDLGKTEGQIVTEEA